MQQAQLVLAAHSQDCCIDVGECVHRQTGLQEELMKTRCQVAGSKAVIAVLHTQLVTILYHTLLMCMLPLH